MKNRSLFKIFDDFSTKQISKITALLDPQRDSPNTTEKEQRPGRDFIDRKSLNPDGLVAALDVGSSKISVVIGRLNQKGLIEVVGLGQASCDGLIRGSVSNINKVAAAIKLALSAATTQANVEIKEVYASYSGQIINHIEHGVLLRHDQTSEVSENDIYKLRMEMFNAVLPAGERLIYLQAKPFTLDAEPGIKDPVGMSGTRIEADFQLITANTTPIDYLFKCCAQAGIVLKEVIPSAIASAEAVICEDEMEESIAVVDIGAAVTSVAVYNNGKLIHTENFPLGGNNISLDIRDFTGLQLRQAELLKKQFGSLSTTEMPSNEIIEVSILNGTKIKEVSRKDVCEVIKSRVEELISMAHSIVNEANKGKKLIYGVVYTGGITALPYFKELAREVTGAECHLGLTTLHLAPQHSDSHENDIKLEAPSYATAIGLLRIGLLNNH
jgi:cell division protein FtsA